MAQAAAAAQRPCLLWIFLVAWFRAQSTRFASWNFRFYRLLYVGVVFRFLSSLTPVRLSFIERNLSYQRLLQCSALLLYCFLEYIALFFLKSLAELSLVLTASPPGFFLLLDLLFDVVLDDSGGALNCCYGGGPHSFIVSYSPGLNCSVVHG